jgi:hypothetical protein
MSDRITLLAPGVFLGDEVAQSGDPGKHADDLVATILREGMRWCALQVAPGNEASAPLLREACARRGAAFGTWAQGLAAADELAAIGTYGSSFHVANVEAPGEDAAWTDAALDALAGLGLEHGLGVIFTEGAWGRDRARSRRWRERGAIAIPEAIVSENPQATIGAMLELAGALGWPAERTAPCCYLTRGFRAAGYAAEIAATGGRWSIFRYGDIGAGDWEAMQSWPRAEPPARTARPEPAEEPVPAPRPARPSGAGARAMRAAVVEAVERWNPDPPPTSRGAVIRRVAQAPDAAWRVVAPQLVAALDAAAIPGAGGGAAPATPPAAPPSPPTRAPAR